MTPITESIGYPRATSYIPTGLEFVAGAPADPARAVSFRPPSKGPDDVPDILAECRVARTRWHSMTRRDRDQNVNPDGFDTARAPQGLQGVS